MTKLSSSVLKLSDLMAKFPANFLPKLICDHPKFSVLSCGFKTNTEIFTSFLQEGCMRGAEELANALVRFDVTSLKHKQHPHLVESELKESSLLYSMDKITI